MSVSRPDARGQMVNIGGRRLHVVCVGPENSDRPRVLLEAGAFGFSADWADVQAGLAERGFASIAYDRAGLGFSDPGPAPRDGVAIGSDAEALLDRLAPNERLILCGHSMAGLHIHRLAVRRRERVAGLVLVDAATPLSMNSKVVSTAVAQFAGLSRLVAWGAETGLLRPLSATPLGDRIGLDGEAGEVKRWAFADAGHNAAAAAEVAEWPAIARQAKDAGELDPDWPVAVILAGSPETRSGMSVMQTAPARASKLGSIDHVADANHASMLALPHAEVIVRAVERVSAAAVAMTA